MKTRRRKTNLGILLLFTLVVGVVIYCVIDETRYNSRKDAAKERAKAFITNLASVCTWPKNMPDVDPVELERNPDKYLPYLDAGLEKVKPYIFESKELENELKNYGLSFIRDYLVIDEKPSEVTFNSEFSKIIIKKDTAIIKGVVNSKATTPKAKIKEKQIQFELHLEYQNENWVVVDYLVTMW